MSIRFRIMFLLGGLLAVLIAALLILQWQERNETKLAQEDEQQSRIQMLNHWLDLTGRTLPQTAADMSQSEAFSQLVMQPRPENLQKIRGEMERLNLEALWIVEDNGTPLIQVDASSAGKEAAPLRPLLPEDDLKSLVTETPNARFFAEQDGGIFEVCIRRLSGGTGRPWLLLAHRWDDNYLKNLSGLTESTATLVSANALTHAPVADGGNLVLLRPLNDWEGHPLRALRLEYGAPSTHVLEHTHSWQAWLFIIFGLLVLTALGIALQRWVLHPLRQISDSLAHEETTSIRSLRNENTELGKVAQLVGSSFAQREELRRTIEERAKLGRDLHDGVIQSLYAAGMGLASVRMLLPPEHSEANSRIEQTRNALNETIRDVRNFITGLEPEALKKQNFTQAIVALLDFIQSIRPTGTSVNIDEHVANRLSPSQRINALQIAREAVSNAIRHGEASHVQVSLQARDSTVEFEISDDGKGFDPATLKTSGHGLENFARRARELGAEFTIDSKPGHGTQIKLIFPLPI